MQVTLSAFFMVLTLSPLLSPAEAGSSRFIEAGKREPLRQKGYIDFCEDHPKEECDKKKTIVPPLPLEENNISKKVFLQELTSFNTHVNQKITAGTDFELFGVRDKWLYSERNDFKGDCEDFAIYKKRQLIKEKNWPESAFSYAIVISKSPTGLREWHTVLLVRTQWGDFVLDNLRNEVLRWDQIPSLHFIQFTNPELPSEWLCVQNNPLNRSWDFYKHLKAEKMHRVFCLPEKQADELAKRKKAKTS